MLCLVLLKDDEMQFRMFFLLGKSNESCKTLNVKYLTLKTKHEQNRFHVFGISVKRQQNHLRSDVHSVPHLALKLITFDTYCCL